DAAVVDQRNSGRALLAVALRRGGAGAMRRLADARRAELDRLPADDGGLFRRRGAGAADRLRHRAGDDGGDQHGPAAHADHLDGRRHLAPAVPGPALPRVVAEFLTLRYTATFCQYIGSRLPAVAIS